MNTTKPTRVLIVDDDADCRNMLVSVLGLLGFETAAASHGLDALAQARSWRPSVVLLDLMMPVLDGAGFRREQRRDPAIAHIPVIVMSAHFHAEAIASELGAALLPKPVDFDRLLDLIGVCCATGVTGKTLAG